MTTASADRDPVMILLEAAASGGAGWPQLYPGSRPFGYFCSYWPEELILSLGREPLRLLPPAAAGVPARLPAYCCLPARACLAAGEAKEYDFLAGAGFAHTCDTIQCLAGIWPHRHTFMFVPPVTMDSPEAGTYFKAELERLWRRLAETAGVQSDAHQLQRAVVLMNRIRSLAGQLDELRPQLPSPLVAALMRAGQLMPRAAYAASLEAALPALAVKADGVGERRRLLISGSILENDGLYVMLEELGARVVADDTCTGYRHFAGLVNERAEPLAGIAARYAARPPCPCRHQYLEARLDYLLALARRRSAEGVVLVVRKYCDPHAWDAAAAGDRLREAGVPVLVLEMETSTPGGQERTRLQAFLECL
ncbi:2-hydroxyacyl-CoA dehydratase subunit D [Desulfotomaculum copahuensis]|uniref:2-hydroxyglutaryl-CoA dehydratase n=1 Tax=Desulfotomaculum copahuensis TaxID=1838280 RepID=A0A1B7LKK6_9FIRM|nr:2-hydroxyacyl-CoA dehydratase family protein [Desulfotomaculum copahuensis]OAT87088.1 hypothetical protein A6M21_02015 [Desulfotomaculum copahuensis]